MLNKRRNTCEIEIYVTLVSNCALCEKLCVAVLLQCCSVCSSDSVVFAQFAKGVCSVCEGKGRVDATGHGHGHGGHGRGGESGSREPRAPDGSGRFGGRASRLDLGSLAAGEKKTHK